MSFQKVLFVLKFRDTYYGYSTHISSGLLNSAKFVNDMLVSAGVESKLIEVEDNNDIDREVFNFKPDIVIIEALWVVPEKFTILQKLHPNVKWVVRLHSELPFIAAESIAMDWILKYVKFDNVSLAVNSDRMVKDLRGVVSAANPSWTKTVIKNKVFSLLNYYPTGNQKSTSYVDDSFIFVGCFGANRPLKNQLLQAVAAIKFAESKGKTLIFHVNGTRNEQGGLASLKNLRSLFEAMPKHQLVEIDWMEHEDFLVFLSAMDINLQVSLSETFNIVSADAVSVGVPIVVSAEIPWSSTFSQADPHSVDDIVAHITFALDWKVRAVLNALNLRGLKNFSKTAKTQWLAFLTS